MWSLVTRSSLLNAEHDSIARCSKGVDPVFHVLCSYSAIEKHSDRGGFEQLDFGANWYCGAPPKPLQLPGGCPSQWPSSL